MIAVFFGVFLIGLLIVIIADILVVLRYGVKRSMLLVFWY